MILAKSEGWLGVRDQPIITRSADIKRVAKFWDHSDSILTQWNQKRYIKARSFDEIQPKPTIDSTFWKSLLAAKEDIDYCLYCRIKYRVHWKGGISLWSVGAISESIAPNSPTTLLPGACSKNALSCLGIFGLKGTKG